MNQFPHDSPPTGAPMPVGPQPGHSLAIASLVLGILSLFFMFIPMFPAFIVAIVGIVLAIAARKRGNTSGMATAGLVCSIIALVLTGLVFVACFMCACAVAPWMWL
ncbi:MAG: DUF4190 domain-containing protein [Clostridiales bacterium]|nr:DUF4190 domain-containing protein [Clostridiales bacterium]